MSTPGESLMLASLSAYFEKTPAHREAMHAIISGSSPVSLRVIDWFVTHYTKAKHVFYWIDTRSHQLVEQPSEAGTHLKKVHLYLEYRAQLKSYTKVHFDPFRRHERISFVLEKDPLRVVETTVGQLNFFRWALQMHVIDYIQAHLSEIEQHMSESQRGGHRSGTSGGSAATGKGAKGRVASLHAQSHTMPTTCFLRFD